MKKIVYTILVMQTFICLSCSSTVTGGVTKTEASTNSYQIIDSKNKQAVSNAEVTIPQKNYKTFSDKNGRFKLEKIQITQPTILCIKKEGYRPFSLTINNQHSLNTPFTISIEQEKVADIKLSDEILHLGDNNFSKNSANSADLKLQSIGISYSKDFFMESTTSLHNNFLNIGSIIGLDTMLAKAMGQNNIKSTYSTPTEVYFNGALIGTININGDNQRIKIPTNLIKSNQKNELTIKTGHNIIAHNHIDYDDIEIMNLLILQE